MNMLKKILAISLAMPFIIFSGVTGVLAAEESGFVYEDNGDGTATITDYTGVETDIVIPSILGDLWVTDIGYGAFYNKGLTSVEFPDGIKAIEGTAFDSNLLTEVVLPEGVTSIGMQAFGANDLTRVTIPSSITFIHSSSFSMNQAFHPNMVIVGFDSTLAQSHAEENGYTFESLGPVPAPSTLVYTKLHGGELSLEAPDYVSFGDITLQNQPKTYHAALDDSFIVKDLRGTQEGWRLDVSATPFTIEAPEGGFAPGTEAYQLPTGSLSLLPVETIERVGSGMGELPISSLNSKTIIDEGVITVAEAAPGTGMGEFNLTFPMDALSLVVDATTVKIDSINYVDSYTPYESTISWNLVSAP